MKFFIPSIVLLLSTLALTGNAVVHERDVFDTATSLIGGAVSTATSAVAGALSTATSAVHNLYV